MVHEHRWFSLTPKEQEALPAAAQMYVIDQRLQALYEEQEAELEILPKLAATDMGGVVGKLTLASCSIFPDTDPVESTLLRGALNELHRLSCPGCNRLLQGMNG
jgi:hypothetical protein